MRKKCTGHLVKTNPNKANLKTEDRKQKTEDSGEKIGLTMVCSDIIVLAFIEVMTNTCGRAIGAEYGQK